MFKYFRKLFNNLFFLLIVAFGTLANWQWPFYAWFGDTTINRFIWLGFFFIFLDIFFEIIFNSIKDIELVIENANFFRNIHKLSDGFRLLSKLILPNDLKIDFVVVGSSGVWAITVNDGGGNISFNGDELMRDNKILKGLFTQTLEKSYTLAEFLKKNLNRDFKVAPVIAFSSPKANLSLIPKIVRGVYISSRKDINSLIENTDVQLIDKKTTDEIYKILKSHK